MKKILSCLVAAVLLLSSVSALASELMTLDEKLALQLQNGSGLTAEVSFTASSELKLSVLDEKTNSLLKTLLPGAKLTLKSIGGAGSGNRGKQDMTLSLSRGAGELAQLRHVSDGVLESFTSTLLGGKTYTSARGDGRLLDLLLDRDTVWPGLERAIFAINGADLEWRRQAEEQLKPVSEKLSLWLQGYTRVSTEKDSKGQMVTVNTITIPMNDVKAEMKTLLADLYANRALSGLLREVMTAAEAAAYLEPGMLQGFNAAIDRLPAAGSVTISRRYNAAGRTLLDDMVFPMGGARGIQTIHYRLEAADGPRDTTLVEVSMLPKDKKNEKGSFYSLSFEGGTDPDAAGGENAESYTGTLTVQSEPAGNEGFTVQAADASAEKKYGFNLFLDRGSERQDAQTRRFTRAQEYSLVIKPQNIAGEGDQSLRLSLTLSSGADTRSATQFEGTFSWKDMASDTGLEAAVSGKSTAPWMIPSVETDAGSIRLDRMSDSQLAEQKTQLKKDLLAAVTKLGLAFLMPAL